MAYIEDNAIIEYAPMSVISSTQANANNDVLVAAINATDEEISNQNQANNGKFDLAVIALENMESRIAAAEVEIDKLQQDVVMLANTNTQQNLVLANLDSRLKSLESGEAVEPLYTVLKYKQPITNVDGETTFMIPQGFVQGVDWISVTKNGLQLTENSVELGTMDFFINTAANTIVLTEPVFPSDTEESFAGDILIIMIHRTRTTLEGERMVNEARKTFLADGVTKDFEVTTSYSPGQGNLEVYLDGLCLLQGTSSDYTVSIGTGVFTVSFPVAPPVDSIVTVVLVQNVEGV